MNGTFIAISLLMLTVGLNVPGLSQYLVIVASVWLLFRWLADPRVDREFAASLSVLTLFALSYYCFSYLHEITGLNEGIRNFLTIIGCYALGYTVDRKNTAYWPQGLVFPLCCMIVGFVCFSFLSVHSLLSSADLVQIVERKAPSFWDGSEINAPGLGANASLGMCLLPMAFFGASGECNRWRRLLIALGVSLLFLAGVYINAALQNRTPFLATAVAVCLGTVLYWQRHRTQRAKMVKTLAALSISAAAAAYYLATRVDLSQYNILVRFTEERFESLRYQAWRTMLGSLHESLLGGRVVRLGEDINYVHNLWLDVIWDAGLVPFLFLAAFHLKHVACFGKILKSELPLLLVLMMVGLATSFAVNFMQEPTLSASVPYFAASCFFLGLVMRLSKDLENDEVPP